MTNDIEELRRMYDIINNKIAHFSLMEGKEGTVLKLEKKLKLIDERILEIEEQ